jgi:hypothetical protein
MAVIRGEQRQHWLIKLQLKFGHIEMVGVMTLGRMTLDRMTLGRRILQNDARKNDTHCRMILVKMTPG